MGTPYNGVYGEALPARSTFFRLEVYKRVGISLAEVQKKRVENCHLGILKVLSKYLEQLHLAAKSSKFFKEIPSPRL